MSSFWFIIARADNNLCNNIPLSLGKKILLLFTSREKAEEFLTTIDADMQAWAQQSGSFTTYYTEGNFQNIKEHITRGGRTLKRYIVDPNPKDNDKEILRKSLPLF